MVQGTLYKSLKEGAPLRTRAIFPTKFVEFYKLDIKLSDPDSHFPSEFATGPFVPSFRYANGETLTESIPISLMLVDLLSDKGTLYGDGSEADKARILSWMYRWNNDFMVALATQFRMSVGRLSPNRAVFEAAAGAVDRQALIFNEYLTHHTYLVGETVTLADLYGAPMLLRAVTGIWGPNERAKYPALLRWFNTVKNHPVFGGFFDSVEFTSVAATVKFD